MIEMDGEEFFSQYGLNDRKPHKKTNHLPEGTDHKVLEHSRAILQECKYIVDSFLDHKLCRLDMS